MIQKEKAGKGTMKDAARNAGRRPGRNEKIFFMPAAGIVDLVAGEGLYPVYLHNLDRIGGASHVIWNKDELTRWRNSSQVQGMNLIRLYLEDGHTAIQLSIQANTADALWTILSCLMSPAIRNCQKKKCLITTVPLCFISGAWLQPGGQHNNAECPVRQP